MTECPSKEDEESGRKSDMIYFIYGEGVKCRTKLDDARHALRNAKSGRERFLRDIFHAEKTINDIQANYKGLSVYGGLLAKAEGEKRMCEGFVAGYEAELSEIPDRIAKLEKKFEALKKDYDEIFSTISDEQFEKHFKRRISREFNPHSDSECYYSCAD